MAHTEVIKTATDPKGLAACSASSQLLRERVWKGR